MSQSIERLFRSWWQLPLVVLIVAVVPIVLLGEISASQARDRALAQERDRVAALAQRAGDLIEQHVATMTDQLSTALDAMQARAGLSQGLPGIRQGEADLAAWSIQLSAIKAAMRVDVDRMIAADQGGDVLASDPPDLLASDVRGTALFTGWNRAASKVIRGDTFGRASDHFTVAVGGPRRNGPRLIAEIPSARIASWLAPVNNEARSIDITDASNATVAALRTAAFDRAGGDSSTAHSMTPDWTVMVTAVASPAVDEIEAGLERERLLRVALAGALLLGSVLLARATSRTLLVAVENVRLADEVRDQSRLIESAARNKSAFLANLSHEFRTPLNAIIGFADVLGGGLSGILTDRQREYVSDIADAGRHLLSLVNDVLDLSKVEAGQMTLDLHEFALRSAVESDVALIRERAGQHGIRISLDMDPTLGSVTADERKVKQVVLNLLSNAVKFTPDDGRIEVRAARSADSVEIVVSDTGPGIADEDRRRIFEEFAQTAAGARQSEGTGLGLSLSKRMVELHGGTITVDSAPGKGSTFTVTLPLIKEK